MAETAGRETTATVTMPAFSLRPAFETSLVEENELPLPCAAHSVQTTLAPFAMRTLRLGAKL